MTPDNMLSMAAHHLMTILMLQDMIADGRSCNPDALYRQIQGRRQLLHFWAHEYEAALS